MSEAASDILGFECKHVTYVPAKDRQSDAHIVKEYVYRKDGSRTPRIRILKDYQIPFYVTREGARNHTQKKEWESLNKLQKFMVPRYQLLNAIPKALGMPGLQGGLRTLARSPYLYGTDIPSTSLVKKDYWDKWPDQRAPNCTMGVMDIETDVVSGTEDIIIKSFTFKNHVYTAVLAPWVQNIHDVEGKVLKAIETYLGQIWKDRNIQFHFKLCNSPAEVVKFCIDGAHEQKPDFVSFWNIDYDMPRMERALLEGGFDPADVFSDPSVPPEYRKFRYIQGPSQKVTQSGKVMSIHTAERWHTVETPASFYFIDSMCLFCRTRIHEGKFPGGYGLDNVLKAHGLGQKLNFDAVAHIDDGLEWHKEMQRNFKIEYIVYNIYDCIGVELLDEKIGDVSTKFPAACDISDYNRFNSNPSKIWDDMYFMCLEEGDVAASTSDEMSDKDDSALPDLSGWVSMFSPLNMGEDGLALIRELPHVHSSFFIHNADADVASTYPSVEVGANIGKSTTFREVIEINGIPDAVRREVGINLSGGEVNAIEHCNAIHGFPLPHQWLAAFEEDMKVVV